MKSYLLLFAVFVISQTRAQVVPSSCSASDSIVALYENDADRLALRRIFSSSSTYIDSVHIPQLYTDTFLNPIIAVYNATSLPARDTVTDMLNIHTLTDIGMDRLAVNADSTLSWMQQLRLSNIPTGTVIVDSLISEYGLHLDQYYAWPPNFGYHTVTFTLDSNHNISALGNLFEALPGVISTSDNYFTLDGSNITSVVHPTHIELVYSYGWDDCWNGCIYRRYWRFNVYYDCSVEFVNSFGDTLPSSIIGIDEKEKFQILIYPNPVSENLILEVNSSSSGKNALVIYNLLGEQVLKENFSTPKHSVHVTDFPMGIYTIEVKNQKSVGRIKFLKN